MKKPLTPTERKLRSRANAKASGLKRYEVTIPDTVAAVREIRNLAENLRARAAETTVREG